jgi:hypothetical protein
LRTPSDISSSEHNLRLKQVWVRDTNGEIDIVDMGKFLFECVKQLLVLGNRPMHFPISHYKLTSHI